MNRQVGLVSGYGLDNLASVHPYSPPLPRITPLWLTINIHHPYTRGSVVGMYSSGNLGYRLACMYR